VVGILCSDNKCYQESQAKARGGSDNSVQSMVSREDTLESFFLVATVGHWSKIRANQEGRSASRTSQNLKKLLYLEIVYVSVRRNMLAATLIDPIQAKFVAVGKIRYIFPDLEQTSPT